MTVDTLSPVMNPTTVKNAKMTIVRIVRHTAEFVTQQFAWDAAMNARLAASLFADTVPPNAQTARKHSAMIVLMKKVYVITAKSRERNKKMKNLKKNQQNQRPSLRFSPTAWAKLVFLRDITDNEVGGFGITEADDLLFVTDFALVKQKVTSVSVSFDDNAVADFFEDQVEAGRRPEQFARVWLHTHPGNSPQPSGTDESTFQRVFGSCDWSIMAIVAQDGSTYARLRFNAGPGGEVKIPVCVDYNCEFDATDFDIWQQQYMANVTEDNIFALTGKSRQHAGRQEEVEVFGCDGSEGLSVFDDQDLLSEIESMDPMEREHFMEELSVRSDFWDEYESEVLYE
jgi:proteasome lid subunit RPN8/RPN11